MPQSSIRAGMHWNASGNRPFIKVSIAHDDEG
jgi:hypothetical protein